MGRRGYPPEFRRRALDLLAAGRRATDLARDLGVSSQTLYLWRHQEQIDRGLVAGLTSTERTELAAAKRRIPSSRRSSRSIAGHPNSWWTAATQKAVRGDRADRRRAAFDPARLPGPAGVRVRLLRPASSAALGPGDPPCGTDRSHRPGPPRQPRHVRRAAGPRRAHAWPWPRRGPQRDRAAHAPSRARRRVRTAALPAHPQRGHRVRSGRTPVRPEGAGPVWVTDITEHPTREGKVY